MNHIFLSNFEVPIPNYLSNWITPPSFKYHTLFEDNLITNRYGWWKKIQHTNFFRICRFNQCTSQIFWLVVSIPLKNISQNGNLPQIGVNIKNIWNHHTVLCIQCCHSYRQLAGWRPGDRQLLHLRPATNLSEPGGPVWFQVSPTTFMVNFPETVRTWKLAGTQKERTVFQPSIFRCFCCKFQGGYTLGPAITLLQQWIFDIMKTIYPLWTQGLGRTQVTPVLNCWQIMPKIQLDFFTGALYVPFPAKPISIYVVFPKYKLKKPCNK